MFLRGAVAFWKKNGHIDITKWTDEGIYFVNDVGKIDNLYLQMYYHYINGVAYT